MLPLPPIFSVETRSVLEAVTAGKIPQINPAAKETSIAKPRTLKSTPASAARGTLAGMNRSTAGVHKKAKPQPARPPATPSVKLSANNCHRILLLPAPKAESTAISR